MPRKNKRQRLSVSILRRSIVILFVVFLCFVVSQKIIKSLKRSAYFVVKDVIYDPSVFADSRYIRNLKGKNLFSLDTRVIHKKISVAYPRISNLLIIKKFPDKIIIEARRRKPYAQIMVGRDFMTIDKEANVIAYPKALDKKLFRITGISLRQRRIREGTRISSRRLKVALEILREFSGDTTLSSYRIEKVDVSNLSQIDAFLTSGLKIIFNKDNIPRQIGVLSFLFKESPLDFGEVSYIDLRFKELILKKKD